MKIKIYGLDLQYDSEHQPIMIILSESDKKNLLAMITEWPKSSKYCAYPDTWPQWEINEFMEIEDED